MKKLLASLVGLGLFSSLAFAGSVNDGMLKLFDDDLSNYVLFDTPSAFASNRTCTLQDAVAVIPYTCVDLAAGESTLEGFLDVADLQGYSAVLTEAEAAAAYQPLDSDLTSWAGVTRAAGFDTFTGTPSSANLAALVTGETGTGALVFGTAPDLTISATTETNIEAAVEATSLQGYGTGVATWLGTPSSANLAAAVTGETGTGALVFGTAPDLTISATTETNIEAAVDLPDLQGTLTVAKGGTGAAPGADDQVLVSSSTSAAAWASIPDCDGDGTTLNYDITTNAFSCGDDDNSGGAADGLGPDGDKGDVTVGGTGTTLTIDADSVALGTDTTGNYVASVADGTGIDGTSASEGGTYTPTLDLTELNSATLGAGSFTTLTLSNSSGSTATPSQIDMGGSYADTIVGSKAKFKFYNDGTSANVYGVGISASRFNTFVGSGATFNILFGDSEELRADTSNFFPVTNDGNALGKSGNAWADLWLASGGLIEFDGGTTNTFTCTGGNCSIEGNGLYRAGGTDVAVADGGTGASSLADLITLGTHTTGNYVASVADGVGIDVTGTAGEGWTATVNLDFGDAGSDPALSADNCRFTSDATVAGWLVCEGDTADTFETRIDVTDPTADRKFLIPNADSVAVQPFTCSGSDKISGIDANGVISCNVDAGGGGATLADGDYGDIVVSGTGTVMDLDELGVEAELEAVLELADLQGSLTLAGDVDGSHGSNDIDEAAVESELEGVLDEKDLQVADEGADPALSADRCAYSLDTTTNGEIVCEGDTANTIETRIVITDPTTSDKTFTIPDANSIALADGDKGDITVGSTGTDWQLDAGSVGTNEAAALDTGDITTGTFADARVDGSLEADEVNPTLGTQTQGNYVAGNTAGTGIAVTGSAAEGWSPTIALDFGDAGADPALSADQCRFSGDATSNGELVCEGDTANTIETRIIITDPTTSDKTFTIPDATSYAATDGDKGDITVGSSGGDYQIDAGAVGTNEAAALDAGDTTTGTFGDARVDGSLEADELVLAGDIDGTANANDIDEAAVETELESVIDLADLQGDLALGTKTSGNYVADVAAGLGLAVTGSAGEGWTPTLALSFSDAGADPALNADECRFSGDATSNGELVCEGDTANTSETRIVITDPTADRTFTIPDANSIALADGDKGDITVGSTGTDWQLDAGSVGTNEAAALDAGDTTTGTFGDARVDGSLEADELTLAGDIDGTANANDIDEVAVETELESVLDLADLQGTITGSKLTDGSVEEADLNVADAPADEECLTYESATTNFEWQACGGGGGLANVVEDTTPQLGGDLDLNTNAITGTGDINITGDASVTGLTAASVTTTGAIELGNASDTTLARSAAGEATLEGDAIKHAGKETLWIPASAITPNTTNGCSPATNQTSTNLVIFPTCNFNTTTQQAGQFNVAFPKSWNEGTVSAIFYWSHPATATNFGVEFDIACVSVSNDDAQEVAFGTAVEVGTDTGGTTDDVYVTSETGAVTCGGTPAEGDLTYFRVRRVPADAGDTLAVDARLHGVKVIYTSNAGTDD